jgi:hypothetical protein
MTEESHVKATLTFHFPGNETEFRHAIDGNRYYSVLHDFDQHLRGVLKYGTYNPTPEQAEFTEKLRDKLHEMLDENNLTLEY